MTGCGRRRGGKKSGGQDEKNVADGEGGGRGEGTELNAHISEHFIGRDVSGTGIHKAK